MRADTFDGCGRAFDVRACNLHAGRSGEAFVKGGRTVSQFMTLEYNFQTF